MKFPTYLNRSVFVMKYSTMGGIQSHGMAEREREKERERERERERDRETDVKSDRHRNRGNISYRQTNRPRAKERKREGSSALFTIQRVYVLNTPPGTNFRISRVSPISNIITVSLPTPFPCNHTEA